MKIRVWAAIGTTALMAMALGVVDSHKRAACGYHIFQHLDYYTNYRLSTPPSAYKWWAYWLQFEAYDPTNDRRVLHEMLPGLFLSNRYAAMNREALRHHGITHIVVAGDNMLLKPYFTSDKSLSYLHLSLRDNPSEEQQNNLQKQLPEAMEFITQALSNPVSRKNAVLVHCSMGISRSASIIAAYLIAERNFDTDQAIDWMKRRRVYANPNEGFVKQLRIWEKLHREKLKEKPAFEMPNEDDE